MPSTSNLMEVDADVELDLDVDSQHEVEAEQGVDTERRRRRRRRRAARRAARRMAKARRRAAIRARKAAKRARRAARRAARRLKKMSKRNAKKLARSRAMRALASKLRRAGRKGRRQIMKSKKQVRQLAKQLKLSAAQVKRALRSPKRMIKKARKMAKKAKRVMKKQLKKNLKKAKKANKKAKKVAKKAKKAAKKGKGKGKGKSGKFRPKGLNIKKTPLSKKLKKVVETEPESAAIAKAKNNWAWEDRVVKRLDGYVPPNPKDIKNRIGVFESDSDHACTQAEVLCVQSKIEHPVNLKTCKKAQRACFHSKVALRVIREASVVCVKAEVPCARKDWVSKGKCIVEKARCKRLLNAAEYQYAKIHKVGKKVRDMHFNDDEANLAIDSVTRSSADLVKAQNDHDSAEDKAMKCSETISVAETCELNMDETPKCVKAKKDVTVCKAVVKDFRKLQKNLKKQLRKVDFAINRRNAAQTEAKMGAAY